ncbi:MAG: hypothetical protein EOP00_25305, partial [Pedobacter sp.]
KKSLVALSAFVILLSGCQSEDTLGMLPDTQLQQVESLAVDDAQAEKTVSENEKEIEALSKRIFLEHFADDTDVVVKNDVAVQNKGGMLFNLLNKSKLAQKLGYAIANYPVKAKFNQHGKTDTIPRINADQIAKLQSVLQPGDLILCGNDDSFIHAILHVGNGEIVHSLASKDPKFWGVVNEPLTSYLKRAERDKFVVLRYKDLDKKDFAKAATYAKAQVGKPYDTLFLINSESKFYCTELVYQSIMQLENAPKIFPHKEKLGWQLITNEDFMDSPDLETVWTLNKTRPATAKIHKY